MKFVKKNCTWIFSRKTAHEIFKKNCTWIFSRKTAHEKQIVAESKKSSTG
jgi:hypothetical protein